MLKTAPGESAVIAGKKEELEKAMTKDALEKGLTNRRPSSALKEQGVLHEGEGPPEAPAPSPAPAPASGSATPRKSKTLRQSITGLFGGGSKSDVKKQQELQKEAENGN